MHGGPPAKNELPDLGAPLLETRNLRDGVVPEAGEPLAGWRIPGPPLLEKGVAEPDASFYG